MSSPLEGVRVIDLSRLLPGPYCTMLLSDLGAEVIRVEQPDYKFIEFPPFYVSTERKESIVDTILMRNKKSIALNLKIPSATQVLYKLVESADILIETFRPGVAAKLQIDYPTLKKINPKLIYCALSGFGQKGPYSKKAAHDLNYAGLSGNLNPSGKDKAPVVPSTQLSDMSGSLFATIGILSALYARNARQNSEGEFLDVSLLDSCFAFNPVAFANSLASDPGDLAVLQGKFPFYNIYRTKDNKFLSVAPMEFKFWREFCHIIDLPHLVDKQYVLGKEQTRVIDEIQNHLLTKDLEDWMQLFDSKEACVFPIYSYKEAIQDPHFKSRGMIQTYMHPDFGKILQPSVPLNFSNSQLKPIGISPILGQDQHEILKMLGYSEDDIENMKKSKIFG